MILFRPSVLPWTRGVWVVAGPVSQIPPLARHNHYRDARLVPSRRRFLTLGSFFEPDLLKKQIGHQSAQP